MIAFSRTGQQNLNKGKVGADDETGKAVEPGVGWNAGLGRMGLTPPTR